MDQTTTSTGGGALAAMGAGMLFVWAAVAIFFIVCMWKIYTKAGQPGWASIIPIYNIIVLLQIAGKPIWWVILLLIPVVNLIVGIITIVALAGKFGKGAGFAIGLILLPIIFYPILAFGDARYSTAPAT